MNFVLFDTETAWKDLLPFTYTRPVSELRIGILTIREKWEHLLGSSVHYLTQHYLQTKYPPPPSGPSLFINSSLRPDQDLLKSIKSLKPGEGLVQGEELLAYCSGSNSLLKDYARIDYVGSPAVVRNLWDLFMQNADAIREDFSLLTKGKESAPLSSTNTVIGDRNLVFLEEGSRVEASVLNTSSGPVYIGRGAEVMEFSAIRGPFALCDHAVVKMSAKIYGATTVGPHSKVGGELNNSVIFGYSNKAHDGFLGNSVIGEWCNLGVDTNNSNLKNNYSNVKIHSFADNRMVDTGLQFCGLFMGDHSKAGINTMFNTGTVVGVGSNIYGGGFPTTSIRSFSWGGSQGFETYKLDKLFETAEKMFGRRGLEFDEVEKNILRHVAEAPENRI